MIMIMIIVMRRILQFIFIYILGLAKACESPIYCKGDLLDLIQESVLFQDSKYFVDMVGRASEVDIIERWREEQLENNSHSNGITEDEKKLKLSKFIRENFDKPGRELRNLVPKDWKEETDFLSKFKKGSTLYSFVHLIHSKWQSLQRKVDLKRICTNCATSMLPLPKPFMVPGGRFRELYYWDSYWIMEGLYVSGMCESATNMMENFSFLISIYGFIPNGSRKYYLNRSQPPLFCTMVERYMKNCIKDGKKRLSFLKEIIPLLDKEYGFWKTQRTIIVNDLSLAIYSANTALPRPESYREDKRHHKNIYKNIASGAESGWDFSSRWFNENDNITSIHTSEIIPLDLNAILLVNEILLGKWHNEILSTIDNNNLSTKEQTEHTEAQGHYRERSKERSNAINEILYSKEDGKFYDFSLRDKKLRKGFFTSNNSMFFHLIGDLEGIMEMDEILSYFPPPFKSINSIKDYFNSSINMRIRLGSRNDNHPIYRGGIPCSHLESGEQWDFPNVWAPIQFYYIRFYLALSEGQKDSPWREKALEVGEKFYKSTSMGYERHGQFFEKYHASDIGAPGGGGEYWVQEGFGWTNGVLLWIFSVFDEGELEKFTTSPSRYTSDQSIYHNSDYETLFLIMSITIIATIAVIVITFKKKKSVKNENI